MVIVSRIVHMRLTTECHKYRVTHTGGDCKDDLNLFKLNNSGFCLEYYYFMAWLMIRQKKEQVYSCRESSI